MHLIQSMRWKPPSHSYEVRPETAVDVCDPASRECADQYGFRVLDLLGKFVDFVPSGMTPPATTDRLTRDPLCEGGFETLGSFQNNPFVANEVHGLSRSHSPAASPNARVQRQMKEAWFLRKQKA